jgi:hypothetical protein
VTLNKELEEVVLQLYRDSVEEFKRDGVDFGSQGFFGKSFAFIPHTNVEARTRIIAAAFKPDLRSIAEEAMSAFYANSAGLTSEGFMCEAVNDFLNYIIPRAAGLSDEAKIFAEAYSHFDQSIYGASFLVTTFAILGNVWDNSGRVVLPDGFSLKYVGPPLPTTADTKWLRDRVVPYYEINSSAHPIGRGRDIKGLHSYFLFEHSEVLPKSRNLLDSAFRLRDEIARKFVFAVRLLNQSGAFSDYRGCRLVSHLSTYRMGLMNFPDEYTDQGPSRELSEYEGLRLRRLLPRLLNMKYDDISVLETKLDDVIRRPRESLLDEKRTALKVAMEQLLDCFQILESIIPVFGSEYIALYATVLLKASGKTQFGADLNSPYLIFKFIKRMHMVRNDIVHGRIDEVIDPNKPKVKPDEVHAFRRMVYDLAALSILNGNLRDIATKLAVGESVPLDFFNFTVQEMNEVRTQKAVQPSW